MRTFRLETHFMPLKSGLLFILLSFAFSGCFDLVEEVNLHADGSGTFGFAANLSQSKIKLQTILALDSLDGYKIPSKEQISREFEKAVRILEKSEGISHVSDKIDFDNYIFGLNFSFTQVKFLNLALADLHKSFTNGKPLPANNGFRQEGKTFERLSEYKAPKEMKSAAKKDITVLNEAFLTCIYRFDRNISSFSNPDAKLSKNGKAVLLKISIPDLISGTKTIANTIQTKTEP